MNKVTVGELLQDKLLSIPYKEDVLTVNELWYGHRFKQLGGVYVFYSKHGEPLYVGISNNVYKRVPEHIQSKKGNPDLIRYCRQFPRAYVEVFYTDDKQHQEIYESYLIAVLNPRFNVQKTGREKI